MAPLSLNAQHIPGDTYFGSNNYVEYIAGDLPIIISAPHGGYLTPAVIPDRVCGNCVTGRDGWTEEIAYELDSAIRVVFGGHPHIIINKLARIKLDANREIVEAALGNPSAETAWHEYHDFIQAAKDSCVSQYGSAIFIDLHAHGHTIQRIELGYLITRSELQFNNTMLDAQNFQNVSSIKHLKNILNPTVAFSNILRGNECMGEFLEKRGYPSVPSFSDPAPQPTDPFFAGGYNTARHGSRDSSLINGIQFETNYSGIRNNNTNRNAFARAVACVLRSYLDQWYFDLDSWDVGHLVTSNADAGPGSLRSALLGAEDGTVITFDGSLTGDTIRLQKELQICSNIILLGPGADSLAISGEDSTRILRIMSGNNVEISGLSLINGNTPASEDGGAARVEGSLRLLHCTLANNHAQDDAGAITLVDSFASLQLDTCQVLNNSCDDDGGAIRCFEGTLTVNASTFQGNTSLSYGGAISMNGTVTVTNSTFIQNQASGYGGGIRNFGSGDLTCTNTTFTENMSGIGGAGISTAAAAKLSFCTIMANNATGIGGGIQVGTNGTCEIQNTLVANNRGSSANDVSMLSGPFISTGNNLIGDTTGGDWSPGPADQLGNLSVPLNPQVMPLGANGGPTMTFALQAGSPCIDQADSVGAPLFDQRGGIRIAGPQPDIGAFELCLPTTATDVQVACDSFIWIDGNTYTSSNSSATYSLTNAAGCDSMITLDLTLNSVDTAITQTATTLSANATGASYQWLDCNNAMQVLPGETQQTFSPLATGNYAVEITQNGCVDTSACYSITIVGIVENDFGDLLIVYPNPTSGIIHIDLGASFPSVTVRINNAAGKLVQTAKFAHSQKINLEIEGSSGYYVVEIVAPENKKAVIKILKE